MWKDVQWLKEAENMGRGLMYFALFPKSSEMWNDRKPFQYILSHLFVFYFRLTKQ